jgi:hypothetical protein
VWGSGAVRAGAFLEAADLPVGRGASAWRSARRRGSGEVAGSCRFRPSRSSAAYMRRPTPSREPPWRFVVRVWVGADRGLGREVVEGCGSVLPCHAYIRTRARWSRCTLGSVQPGCCHLRIDLSTDGLAAEPVTRTGREAIRSDHSSKTSIFGFSLLVFVWAGRARAESAASLDAASPRPPEWASELVGRPPADASPGAGRRPHPQPTAGAAAPRACARPLRRRSASPSDRREPRSARRIASGRSPRRTDRGCSAPLESRAGAARHPRTW